MENSVFLELKKKELENKKRIKFIPLWEWLLKVIEKKF
jgi:hypothetical protein